MLMSKSPGKENTKTNSNHKNPLAIANKTMSNVKSHKESNQNLKNLTILNTLTENNLPRHKNVIF